jgi:energy-converting hydrogenase B subunit D
VTGLQIGALVLIAAGAPVVVLTRDPLRQAFCLGGFGTGLAILFFVFQAPDVALSQIVVSTVALPLMVLLALSKVREHEHEEDGEGEE